MKNYSHTTIVDNNLILHHAILYTRSVTEYAGNLETQPAGMIQYETSTKEIANIGKVSGFQEHQIGDDLIEGRGNVYLSLSNPSVVHILMSLDSVKFNPAVIWTGTGYRMTCWKVYTSNVIFVLNIFQPNALELEGAKVAMENWSNLKATAQLSDAQNLKVENIDDTAGKYYSEASKAVLHHRGSVPWANKRSQADRNEPFFMVNSIEYTEADIINIVQFWQAFEGLQASLGTTPSGTIKN